MKRKMFEFSGLLAIQILRKEKLQNGHTFMINSGTLPDGQCYLEHPDGSIELVTLSRSQKDFERVRVLSKHESVSLLKSLQLT
jgi:hypothetical protein